MPASAPERAATMRHGPGHGGHEAFELDARYLGWFSVFVVLLVIVSAIAAYALVGGFRIVPTLPDPTLPANQPHPASGPALQSVPARDLRDYRQDKAAELEGYRWIDREHGVVQIPIEQAMQLLVDRGAAPKAPEAGR